MTHIGKNIKKIRNVKGLSQQAFADLFNLTRGNISSYEEFRAEPKIETIIKIAHYFSIPLDHFIEKDLSVNELLHYNAELVLETEKLKITRQLIKIPFVPALYISDYANRYNDDNFILKLPQLVVPSNSKFKLIAIELDNPESLPAEFNYQVGDILIYEQVEKENIHRIDGKLGVLIDNGGVNYGVYSYNEGNLSLSLNEWVEYPFDMGANVLYWVVKAVYSQING